MSSKLPNIVIHACYNITEKWLCWKSVAHKYGFVCLCFTMKQLNSLTAIDMMHASKEKPFSRKTPLSRQIKNLVCLSLSIYYTGIVPGTLPVMYIHVYSDRKTRFLNCLLREVSQGKGFSFGAYKCCKNGAWPFWQHVILSWTLFVQNLTYNCSQIMKISSKNLQNSSGLRHFPVWCSLIGVDFKKWLGAR